MKIIKQELQFEECLKQKLEFTRELSKVTPTFINDSIRKNSTRKEVVITLRVDFFMIK